MSQHDYNLADAAGASFRSDLNLALAAILSRNSGATAPSTTVAYMVWVDTTAGVVKRRNAANSAWIIESTIDETFVLSRSTNTILDESDRDKVLVATGSYTQTLTAAATLGDGWEVDVIVDTGVTLVLDPNASETIDGSTTKTIVGPAQGRIVCNGTLFRTIGFTAVDLSKHCGLFNGSIAASVSSNALTLAIKTLGGADPSPANPVHVAFRDATLTGGTVKIREITAALSMTISAGSTLGFTSSESGRIYAGLIDNAGTVELCAWNPLTSSGLRRFSEEALMSTTAEGGAGAADTAGTVYSATARSNVAFRYAGYIDIQTGATAGNWSNSPTVLTTMGPGVARTGDVLQTQYTEVTGVSSGTTTVPLDNTIPQNTEGTEFATLSITPTSALSRLLVETEFNHVLSVAVAGICGLFKDSDANAYQARTFYAGNGVTGAHIAVVKMGLLTPAVSASSQTWRYRAGPNSAATIYINADNVGNAVFNGVCKSTMKITEIQR